MPDRDDAVSLAPLTPEEALRALLAVNSEDEPAETEANEPVGSDDVAGDVDQS